MDNLFSNNQIKNTVSYLEKLKNIFKSKALDTVIDIIK